MHKKVTTAVAVLALVAGITLGASGAHAQTISPLPSLYPSTSPSPIGSPMTSPSPMTTPTTGGVLGTTPTPTTPGAPETGAGGDMALNLLLLLTSGVIAAGGITYLIRSFYVKPD